MATAAKTKLQTITCTQCQQEVSAGAKFCNFCGAPLTNNTPQKNTDPAIIQKTETKTDPAKLEFKFVHKNLSPAELIQLEEQYHGLKGPDKKALLLELLAKTKDKYLLNFILKKLFQLNQPDYEKNILSFLREEPLVNTQFLLAADLTLTADLIEELTAQIKKYPPDFQIWCFGKLLDLAKTAKQTLSPQLNNELAALASPWLVEKLANFKKQS